MPVNTAQQLIYKATVLVDEQDDLEGALAVLRDAISVATVAKRHEELIEAKTFAGEILLNSGREEEALEEFEDVIELSRSASVDPEVIKDAVETAGQWLDKLRRQAHD